MKLLVCVSKTPDTTSKIAFTDGNTTFDTNGIQYIMNPYDEWYAVLLLQLWLAKLAQMWLSEKD